MFNGQPITNGITEGIELRKERGIQIASVARIDHQDDGSWRVPSMAGNGRYTVFIGQRPHCTCPDFETRGCKCKHIYAAEIIATRETTHNLDGTTTVTETVAIKATKRTTYPQNWPAYNAAQTNEGDHFQRLLGDLCAGIVNPIRTGGKGGRPPMPLSDAVFAVVFKVYSTMSGRRFISDLRAAHEAGYVSRLPHFNSIFNYLDNEEMTALLQTLIVETSKPLAAVESDFACDSTGFCTSRFVRWFDHKYGVVRQDHDWVKVHFMTGVKTNVITAVEIHGKTAQDSPLLPALLDTTVQNFDVRELSADKGYSSIQNAETVAAYGATPFIAYKAGHTGKGGGVWAKMFHFFNFKRDEFLAHYHKRSNVESTVHMVKSKFGDAVRSKTDLAMKNEALCKILCHNICCLISAFFELGIESTFWKPAVA